MNTEKRVKEILIERLGVEEIELNLNADLTSDLGCDSLDVVELIMAFEKEFDITIPDGEGVNLNTVGEIINYLNNRLTD